MYEIVQLAAVLTVALAMALSLAHALELPGKKRLDRETYQAVQTIYYPGFTIGGAVGEGGSILLLVLLLILAPSGGADFWWLMAALLALLGMHGVFWIFTQPVNKVWLQGHNLDPAGARFFAIGSKRSRGTAADTEPTWTELRDQWEYSHVARAVLAAMSFVALLFGIR